ncbi:MAG: hypothetical protein JNM60_09615 [Candidatus Competibacteraceae bacterium]|nr:hypothetical protein [Candidatus Competibacteraceae bacterium]
MFAITAVTRTHAAGCATRARRAAAAGTAYLIAALAGPGAFAQTLGDVADIAHESLSPSMELGTALVFFIGFMLVGVCLFKLYVAGRNPGSHSGGTYFASILGLVIGVFMVYQGWVVGMGGETFFDSRDMDVTIDGTTQIE